MTIETTLALLTTTTLLLSLSNLWLWLKVTKLERSFIGLTRYIARLQNDILRRGRKT